MNKANDNQTDGERLQVKFDLLKAKTGMKKAEFARVFNVPGGASMISQHISGNRPISLDAMVAYAKGFACTLSEISPHLAAEVQQASLLRAPDSDQVGNLLANLQDWRAQASSKSQEVIDKLTLLAKKNKLRDEDWQLIDQMVHRFMNR